MKKQEFIELAMTGIVELENDLFYKVVLADDSNIEMSDKLKDQLISENKYGKTYIGVITWNADSKVSSGSLPIYGNANSFVTKFFVADKKQAILNDLKDRQMELLKRAVK